VEIVDDRPLIQSAANVTLVGFAVLQTTANRKPVAATTGSGAVDVAATGQAGKLQKKKQSGGRRLSQIASTRKVQVSDYKRLEKCGKGSFKVCFVAVHRGTGERACMQVLDLCAKKVDVPDVREELRFLDQNRHENCMRMFAFEVDMSLKVTMLVELCVYSLEDLRTAADPKESVRTRIDAGVAQKVSPHFSSTHLFNKCAEVGLGEGLDFVFCRLTNGQSAISLVP
jgi:hypothetical protein